MTYNGLVIAAAAVGALTLSSLAQAQIQLPSRDYLQNLNQSYRYDVRGESCQWIDGALVCSEGSGNEGVHPTHVNPHR